MAVGQTLPVEGKVMFCRRGYPCDVEATRELGAECCERGYPRCGGEYSWTELSVRVGSVFCRCGYP